MAGSEIDAKEELREELQLLRIANDLELKLRKLSPDSEEYEKLSLELKNVQRKYNQLPRYQEQNAKNDTKKNTISTKILDFFFNNRYGFALWACIVACFLSLLFGLIFFQTNFLDSVIDMFLLWCAPAVVAALLVILTPISIDLSFGFGCGLYYGTWAAYSIISKFSWSTNFAWIAGFIFAALVCYIVYLNID